MLCLVFKLLIYLFTFFYPEHSFPSLSSILFTEINEGNNFALVIDCPSNIENIIGCSCTEPFRCSSWSLIRKNNLLLKYYGFQFCFYAFSSVQMCVCLSTCMCFLWIFFGSFFPCFFICFVLLLLFISSYFIFIILLLSSFLFAFRWEREEENVWTLMGGEVGRI